LRPCALAPLRYAFLKTEHKSAKTEKGDNMPETQSHPPLKDAVVCQVGLVVKNAERIAEKMERITGIKPSEPTITDAYDKARTTFRGSPTPARAKLIFFPMGQLSIEIIEPIGTPSTWSEFLDKHGDGVHHIAFTVQNADRSADALATEGLPTLQRGDFEGGKYIYVEGEKDLGCILELLEFT
jgi:methylmalonyl-CoA/ethylmalonyl-CoA epimerase